MLFLIFYGVVNKKELVGGVEKYEFVILEGCGGRVEYDFILKRD